MVFSLPWEWGPSPSSSTSFFGLSANTQCFACRLQAVGVTMSARLVQLDKKSRAENEWSLIGKNEWFFGGR